MHLRCIRHSAKSQHVHARTAATATATKPKLRSWTLPQPPTQSLPSTSKWQPSPPQQEQPASSDRPAMMKWRLPDPPRVAPKLHPRQQHIPRPQERDLMRRFAPTNTVLPLPKELPESMKVRTQQVGKEGHHEKDAELRTSTGPQVESIQYDKDKSRRNQKKIHKSRGSLVEQAGTTDTLISPKQIQTIDKRSGKRPHAILDKRISPDVYIPSVVSVGALAQLLNVKLERLQRKMKAAGMAAEATHDHVLTSDYAVLLAEEFGRHPVINDEMAFDIHPSPPHPKLSSLPRRPPVVTIMGHVDHGKTTLLDTLRATSVAKGEAGGITQHIGAFSVPVSSQNNNDAVKTITFLDTPGHAAFSAMRARGASVTDIIVLVVAADDGVMPQTREVINLIRQEGDKVAVLVAVNKVDKPGVDVEDVQKELMAEGLQLEPFGGDIPCVTVSGLTGKGLPDLVETLSAMAEMQDLRAEHDGRVHGYVIESKVQKGLGSVATVLISRGCLKPGTHIISGLSHAKVRVMNDSSGKAVNAAYPGMAVTISGWKALPNAGDVALEGTEDDIKKAIANRRRRAELEAALLDVEAINNSRKQERERRQAEAQFGLDAVKELDEQAETGPKELKLIIKADVSGSSEAVSNALQCIGNELAVARIVSSTVGDVTESDVQLAKNAGGVVIAFSVAVPRSVENLATQIGVPICSSGIIYRLIEQVTEKVAGLLPVTYETRVTGEATILALFDITEKGTTRKVAGCRVNSGVLERSKTFRVMREGMTVHEGLLDTLKHVKKDITEARKGTDCGLSFKEYGGMEAGDTVQAIDIISVPGTFYMDPLASYPSLIPVPAGDTTEADIDRFSILFSPPTPRASPAISEVPIESHSYAHRDLLTGKDFVVVSEDPLSSSALHHEPRQNATFEFFDKIGRDAQAASERTKKELLAEFDDPTNSTQSNSMSDLDLNFFTRTSPPARSTSVPPPTAVPPLASTSNASPQRSPSRTSSYQTLSNLSARWVSSVIPSHTRTPSLDTLFDPHRRSTPEPIPVQDPTTKPSPFAPHVYVPPTGAPGYKGEQYDWDKGYSSQLERELTDARDPVQKPSPGLGDLMEKKTGIVELRGRKEMTVPVLDSLVASMIKPHLPALARLPRSWSLLYSLDQHGISLNTLYARCETSHKPGRDGALVVIKDAGDTLFGVWCADGIHLGKGVYYGGGESFLWKYADNKFHIFRWTGRNDYVALCEPSFLSFGGGDGHYGLYIDDSLLEGSSAPCPTFNNEPLCSPGAKKTGTVSFECVGLEVWSIAT